MVSLRTMKGSSSRPSCFERILSGIRLSFYMYLSTLSGNADHFDFKFVGPSKSAPVHTVASVLSRTWSDKLKHSVLAFYCSPDRIPPPLLGSSSVIASLFLGFQVSNETTFLSESDFLQASLLL